MKGTGIMEIQRTVTVKLSPEEISEIIKSYLEKEGFKANSQKVEFEVKSHCEGIGYAEHTVYKFEGCTVVCKLTTERKER